MGKNKNWKKKLEKYKNQEIPTPQLPDDKTLKFSFEFYDISCDEYCLSKWGQEKVLKTLGGLKDINSKSFLQLKKEQSTYHFYPVYWEQTKKKDGFPDERIKNLAPYHFALVGVNNQLARVYGAISQGTFYIVWFDLNHAIWSVAKKHT